ncbi:anthranilate phosphoribosyltransferase [Bradyrhizobium sacchari]|uniref:Anthranilate phosphoribosyltransferase n=1 Tax=Bradyrhizobium sacchari TaxID=1399419 RepID=A0A560JA97_9BRAD|nr:anthranilate phosphoribosyltransferase [Bradyrhizobium sacchari]OPY94312.1 anthranilate phosphoribosyltransferase [Bradyrhizobium sacchari]TWB48766.1 anthranilate phosphoribosyltransferase [Bradyrhizobium sacchari]TWB67927.1 anthranilate phosphoribosyltransferase [Bradyrhizobium sacchari]
MEPLKSIIRKVVTGATLTREEAASAFDSMMSGDATPSQIGGLLIGMRVRGETVAEVTGAASAMRNIMPTVETRCDPIDIGGTIDTAMCSLNVSTCASFIVAGVGIPVAKNVNRATSSGSSTADVLARLGVKVDLTPDAMARCVQEADVGFMFASAEYPAMQRISQIRSTLGTHTMFNLVEALSNPARVKRQILGVFTPEWVQPLAHVLKNLGADSVWVVHGSDGLEEITLTGTSLVAAVEAGTVRTFEVTPEEAGLPRYRTDALESSDVEAHAVELRKVLDGLPGRLRDAALLNAAAALVVAGRASTLQEGVALGQESLDRGAAAARLNRLIAVSNA